MRDNFGLSNGVSEGRLRQAIAAEEAIITGVPTTSPPLANPRYLGYLSYTTSNVANPHPQPYLGPRIRKSKAIIRYSLQLLAVPGNAVLEPRFGGYCAGPNNEPLAWRSIELPNLSIIQGTFVYERTHLIENVPPNLLGGLWFNVISGTATGWVTISVESWEGS